MSTYEEGYDPKYGYNRNVFFYRTVGTAVIGRVVKLLVTPIQLLSKAVARQAKLNRAISADSDLRVSHCH